MLRKPLLRDLGLPDPKEPFPVDFLEQPDPHPGVPDDDDDAGNRSDENGDDVEEGPVQPQPQGLGSSAHGGVLPADAHVAILQVKLQEMVEAASAAVATDIAVQTTGARKKIHSDLKADLRYFDRGLKDCAEERRKEFVDNIENDALKQKAECNEMIQIMGRALQLTKNQHERTTNSNMDSNYVSASEVSSVASSRRGRRRRSISGSQEQSTPRAVASKRGSNRRPNSSPRVSTPHGPVTHRLDFDDLSFDNPGSTSQAARLTRKPRKVKTRKNLVESSESDESSEEKPSKMVVSKVKADNKKSKRN